MHLYFDRKWNPIDATEAARLFQDDKRRIVGRAEIGDVIISTVHLVIPHMCFKEDCELGMCSLFETLIFGGERDQEMHRWHTLKDAIRGHAQIITSMTNERT